MQARASPQTTRVVKHLSFERAAQPIMSPDLREEQRRPMNSNVRRQGRRDDQKTVFGRWPSPDRRLGQ